MDQEDEPGLPCDKKSLIQKKNASVTAYEYFECNVPIQPSQNTRKLRSARNTVVPIVSKPRKTKLTGAKFKKKTKVPVNSTTCSNITKVQVANKSYNCVNIIPPCKTSNSNASVPSKVSKYWESATAENSSEVRENKKVENFVMKPVKRVSRKMDTAAEKMHNNISDTIEYVIKQSDADHGNKLNTTALERFDVESVGNASFMNTNNDQCLLGSERYQTSSNNCNKPELTKMEYGVSLRTESTSSKSGRLNQSESESDNNTNNYRRDQNIKMINHDVNGQIRRTSIKRHCLFNNDLESNGILNSYSDTSDQSNISFNESEFDSIKLCENNSLGIASSPDKRFLNKDCPKELNVLSRFKNNRTNVAHGSQQQLSFQRTEIDKSFNLDDAKVVRNQTSTTSRNILPVPSSSHTNIKMANSMFASKDHKYSNRLPVVKFTGLPVIKLTQGQGSSKSREVGFAPLNISTNFESLTNVNTAYSSCSSLLSTGEDFTEFSTCSDLCWSKQYEFEKNETLQILSHSPIFMGAELFNENKLLDNLSVENAASLTEAALNGKQDHPHKILILSNRSTVSSRVTLGRKSNNDLESGTSNNLGILNRRSEQMGEKGTFSFKVPGLPPVKRPPSRSKSNVSLSSKSSSSVGSNCSLTGSDISNPISLEQTTAHTLKTDWIESDADDAISIYAESLTMDNNQRMDKVLSTHKSLKNSSDKTQKIFIKTSTVCPTRISHSDTTNLTDSDDLINTLNPSSDLPLTKNNIKPLMELQIPSELPVGNEPNPDIAQWTATGHYSISKTKFHSTTIPEVFKNLCYFHFTMQCYKIPSKCKKLHAVPKLVHSNIKMLSPDLLKPAYEFAKDRHKLYRIIFCTFIDSFQQYPQDFKLINLIEDVCQIITCDKFPFVCTIIKGLEAQGHLFSEIVWDIMFLEGSKNLTLINILLRILCDRKQDLITNWTIFTRLFKYHSQKSFNYAVIQNVINQCISTKSTDLCKKFINDIIACYQIEISVLNLSSVTCFYMLLKSLNLQQEAELIHEKLSALKIHFPLEESLNLPSLIPDTPVSYNDNNSDKSSSNETIGENVVSECCSFNDFWTEHCKSIVEIATEERGQHTSSVGFTEEQNLAGCKNSLPDICQNDLGLYNNDSLFVGNKAPSVQPVNYNSGNSLLVSPNKPSDLPNTSLLAFSPASATNRNVLEVEKTYKHSPFHALYSSFNNKNESYPSEHNIHSKSTSPLSVNINNNHSSCSSSHLYGSSTTLPNIPIQNSLAISEVLDISEKPVPADDLASLFNIIASANFEEFITILNKYKNIAYRRSFLMSAFSFFKKTEPERTCHLIKSVVLVIRSPLCNDNELKYIVRMLCVNIISILEMQTSFDAAANILETFYTDIHTLVNLQWNMHRICYTSIGKYFYFCRIFTRGAHYKLALNLFTSPELKLLEGQHLWTLPHNKESDLSFGNRVLLEFIVTTTRNDPRIAMHILLYMLSNKNCIYEINVWKWYNFLICKMVDGEYEYLKELQSMLPNILQGWHRHLTDSVLRGLVVILVSNTPFSDIELLYSKCCFRSIYSKITGSETTIGINTDMTFEEIYLLFSIYLNRVIKLNGAVRELTIEILPSKPEQDSPKILANANSSIKNLKNRVCTVLAKAFNHTINVPSTDENSYIRIESKEMMSFINIYSTRMKQPK